MSKSVGIRMDEELLKKLEELSKEERVDRSTLVRKLLRKGITLHKKETAAHKYRKGKITISQAAKEAGTTIWEMEKFLVESGYKSQYNIKDLQRETKI